mmetsp:Transcript_13256/g.24859  ORF Transcript_13256/g.24859 Transcript_13256/m.24859 type:complete len:331 (+) Transcript_13256:1590-2582(+)
MNQPLRRSQRQRVVSRRRSDNTYLDIEQPRDQFRNSFFQKATQPKIELTEREKEILEERQETAYCICGYSETEVKGNIMIACDICDNWFHDECVGLTPTEAASVETYVCPQCSQKPKVYRSTKRAKASSSELEILLGALEQLDDVDKPKPKKKGWEPKSQTPKVVAYHLDKPTNSGRCIGIVGYLRNDSHPAPSLDNGFLAPITLTDIDQGILNTAWGVYRLAFQDGQIALNRDYALKAQSKDSFQGSDSISMEDKSVPLGKLEVEHYEGDVLFRFEGVPAHSIPIYRGEEVEPKSYERLEKMMNVEMTAEAVQKLLKDKLKIKVSILGL